MESQIEYLLCGKENDAMVCPRIMAYAGAISVERTGVQRQGC
jgi:hypothetical protein